LGWPPYTPLPEPEWLLAAALPLPLPSLLARRRGGVMTREAHLSLGY
jgi:hypothetical protein